jgi:hypothetical protein
MAGSCPRRELPTRRQADDWTREAFGTAEQDLGAAACGLVLDAWRNTQAVEDDLHVSGGLHDEDMLRMNA